jgi:hypothetical protein
MKREVDWAARAAARPKRLQPRVSVEEVEIDNPDLIPCEHRFVPGKSHCRECGARSLDVWLDKQLGLKK